MSNAPVWVQVVVIVIGLACLAAAFWAACKIKDRPVDWDYRDDL